MGLIEPRFQGYGKLHNFANLCTGADSYSQLFLCNWYWCRQLSAAISVLVPTAIHSYLQLFAAICSYLQLFAAIFRLIEPRF